MQILHFSIQINAPKEKVWSTMLEDATYRVWTEPFEAGSHFDGSWDEGSFIKFLTADTKTGMYGHIKENSLHEYISVEHIGMIKEGEIDTTSEEVLAWVPAFENYTFTTKDGGTEVSVDIDININDEFKAYFDEKWPEALQILKSLAEKS